LQQSFVNHFVGNFAEVGLVGAAVDHRLHASDLGFIYIIALGDVVRGGDRFRFARNFDASGGADSSSRACAGCFFRALSARLCYLLSWLVLPELVHSL
jgi:hypothetical protein